MPRNLPDQALRLHTLIAMHPLETVRGRIQDELCQGKEEDMRDHEVLWDGCPPKLKGHLAFFEAEVQPSSRSYTQGL